MLRVGLGLVVCLKGGSAARRSPVGGWAMADRAAIKAEIRRLAQDGLQLWKRELIAKASEEQRAEFLDSLDDDAERKELSRQPHFITEYQRWYSQALRVVQQLLPDRYNEFRNFYKDEKRKALNVETYGVADYIHGISPIGAFSPGEESVRALRCLEQQVAILKTAAQRLDSVLTDIGRSLHAEILDNELDAARNLLAASHVRSAGVVAGVALEGHLKKLIADHKVSFRKTATLSNLNNALKDAGIYDTPQWRQIQYLSDIRNLCGHKADRTPERAEVETLINEVSKLVQNLF
jgi:hypothetical protein